MLQNQFCLYSNYSAGNALNQAGFQQQILLGNTLARHHGFKFQPFINQKQNKTVLFGLGIALLSSRPALYSLPIHISIPTLFGQGRVFTHFTYFVHIHLLYVKFRHNFLKSCFTLQNLINFGGMIYYMKKQLCTILIPFYIWDPYMSLLLFIRLPIPIG